MNSLQLKSLQLAKEWLDSVDDDVFLTEYQQFEKHIGPKASEFIIEDKDEGSIEPMIIGHFGENASFSCKDASNDESYALAA